MTEMRSASSEASTLACQDCSLSTNGFLCPLHQRTSHSSWQLKAMSLEQQSMFPRNACLRELKAANSICYLLQPTSDDGPLKLPYFRVLTQKTCNCEIFLYPFEVCMWHDHKYDEQLNETSYYSKRPTSITLICIKTSFLTSYTLHKCSRHFLKQF